MSKPVKYALLALGAIMALAIAAAIALALAFDPNRYKGDIERLAKEQTGRTLSIKGDIKLAFWPSLGARMGGVSLTEKSSSELFLSFDSAHASVKVLPLLRGQTVVDSVGLSGFKARVVKGKDGRFNFSDLVEERAKKPEAGKAETKTAPVVFDIGGVSIERASIAYIDLQAGQEYALEDLRLKTGRIAPDAEGRLELAMVAKRKHPLLQAKLSLDGTYRLAGGKPSVELTAKLDESAIKAKLVLAEPYEFDAAIDRINLDRYLGAEEKKPGVSQKASETKQTDTPVDLSALKGINAKGRLQVGALEVRGLKLADVGAQLNAANGRVALAPHSAKLYEGSVSGAVVVDANRNHVSLKEDLRNVSIGPILRDFAAQDRLEGRGNVSLDVTAAGATVNAMKRSLAGTARVHLRDGAVKGVNVGEILRAAQGGKGGEEPRRTDFSELSASFVIKNGVARNDDLDARAPLFRLGGAGDINVAESSLNYLAKASVVATSKGQGGRELDRLAGLTIPVRLSGSFDDVKYQVDYRNLAGQAAKSQVGEKLEERLGTKLKGLLGR
jgi:AsmA protein